MEDDEVKKKDDNEEEEMEGKKRGEVVEVGMMVKFPLLPLPIVSFRPS